MESTLAALDERLIEGRRSWRVKGLSTDLLSRRLTRGFAGNGIIYALSNVHNISITLHNAKLHERPFGMHA